MNIYEKLLKVKEEIGKVSKDSTNPFFKSKYFDVNKALEHCEPLLQKHGLLLLQPIKDGFVSTIIVDAESSESIESSLFLPNIQDAQKIGSAITYYRRYTLQSLLALQSEDDDGNIASKQVKIEAKPKLTKNGFNYLIDKGTSAEIRTALNNRQITVKQRNELTLKLK